MYTGIRRIVLPDDLVIIGGGGHGDAMQDYSGEAIGVDALCPIAQYSRISGTACFTGSGFGSGFLGISSSRLAV